MKITTVSLNVRSGPGLEYPVVDVVQKGESVKVVDIPSGWVPIEMDDESICWVSGKYLEESKEEKAVEVSSTEPSWITWAKSKLGQKEVPGSGDNPEIVSWYRLTTLPKEYYHDSTAWCAVFVNAALMKSGIKTIKSARAFDWLDWGQNVDDDPQLGDIVVFNFSHVAFYLRGAGTGRITVIGGNQSDAVTMTTFNEETVSGYRRPE